MQAPMNEYYTDEEYEFALRQMRKMMEYQRIQMEASLAVAARKRSKSEFKKNIQTVADQTKSSIKTIQKELDTAIKGASRDKLESLIEEVLPKYDQIS